MHTITEFKTSTIPCSQTQDPFTHLPDRQFFSQGLDGEQSDISTKENITQSHKYLCMPCSLCRTRNSSGLSILFPAFMVLGCCAVELGINILGPFFPAYWWPDCFNYNSRGNRSLIDHAYSLNISDSIPKSRQSFKGKPPDPSVIRQNQHKHRHIKSTFSPHCVPNKSRNFLRYLLLQLQGWKIIPHNIEKNLSSQTITITQEMWYFQL